MNKQTLLAEITGAVRRVVLLPLTPIETMPSAYREEIPSLQDILYVIGQKTDGLEHITTRGDFFDEYGNKVLTTYDLTKPLPEQSEETLLFIHKMIV